MARIENAASGAVAQAETELTTRELQEQIRALKSDIAELTNTVTKYGRAQSDALAAQARAGLRTVADRSAESLNAAQDYAQLKLSEGEEYVRAHPASAVGIAAGLGFLFGLMASRR